MKPFFWLFIFLLPHTIFAQTDFSQENATALLKVLSVDIGPRPMGSPAEQQALQFAVERLKEYGCDTAYIMRFDRTSRVNTNSGVAVGIKKHGATKRIICIGGHIDSADPEVPGADDDGSGSATVMELARVFGKRQMQSTLVFCLFGGEEQGLIGSNYFVNHFEDIDSVALMLQVDMANGLGVIELDPETHGAMAPKWLVTAALEEFYKLGYSGLRYPTHFFSLNYSFAGGAGSDHEPFLQKGIPAIDFSTDVSNPIHTPSDNFENFDQRGLKRSGDLILKLVERFDAGTPSRETENYWLFTVGKTAIFLPSNILWGIIILSIMVGIIALLKLKKIFKPSEPLVQDEQAQPIMGTPKIKWSGVKVFLFTTIVVMCGWYSSEVMSLLKGIRYPWFTDIPLYYLYGFVGALLGVCISAVFSRKLPLSENPFPFFLRAFVLFLVWLLLCALLSPKVALYPALAFFVLSLGIFLQWTPLRIILCLTSFIIMLRLCFHEWDALFYRSLAFGMSEPTTGAIVLLYIGVPLFLVLYLLPPTYGSIALVLMTPLLSNVGNFLASKKMISFIVLSFIGLTVYLYPRQVYNQYWHREVNAIQTMEMEKDTFSIRLTSAEYLSDLRIRHADIETTITNKTTSAVIHPRYKVDTLLRDDYDIERGTSSWVKIYRSTEVGEQGDTTLIDTHLQLQMPFRPFTVSVSYSGKDSSFLDFDTKLQYRTTKSTKKIEWYSFPDSILDIPVKFIIVGNDSVKEEIKVTFNKLAYPMEFERELTTIIPRTVYTTEYFYKR